jgi:hypothetical protein
MRILIAVLAAWPLAAQLQTLSVEPLRPVTVKRGAAITVKVKARLAAGYHTNSNQPADDYLIPLRLTFTPGPLTPGTVKYPAAKMEKFAFSDKPMSVFADEFEMDVEMKAPADAKPGEASMAGKLRYQACNDRMCLPPKTLDLKLPVIVQ